MRILNPYSKWCSISMTSEKKDLWFYAKKSRGPLTKNSTGSTIVSGASGCMRMGVLTSMAQAAMCWEKPSLLANKNVYFGDSWYQRYCTCLQHNMHNKSKMQGDSATTRANWTNSNGNCGAMAIGCYHMLSQSSACVCVWLWITVVDVFLVLIRTIIDFIW